MIENNNAEDRLRPILKILAVVLAVIMIISAVFYVIGEWERRTGVYTDAPPGYSDELEYNGNKYNVKDNVETVLVIGLDKPISEDDASYNNSKQADFIMLFVMDNTAKTSKAIHINRDTIASMNILGVAGETIDTVTQQIALSHTYGNGKEVSCRNVANSVSKLLMGVEIDHYVSVPLDAVPVFNDLVDGVTVEILDDFSQVDASLVKGEKITLNGEQALKYIQSRQGVADQSNANRMARQRQYITALYDKFVEKSKNNSEFVADSALEAADYIISDCSVNKLEGYLNKLTTLDFSGISEIEGEIKKGEEYMEFHPDTNLLKQLVIDTFYQLKK